MSSKKMMMNGKEVAFKEGSTILEAAREAGIYIPSLCYHGKTGPASRCRACVVEVEGMRGLQTSCSVQAQDGMVAITDSEAVLDAQRMVINLLLANGQHNCLTCEANGDCELQNAAYYLGIEVPSFVVETEPPQIDDSSEMIVVDHRKCIKCGRCIEGDNCTVVNEVLDFGYRGHDTKVVCDDDLPMGDSSCVQCGECVQLCPVGAILDKRAIGKGRTWELRKVDTVCPYCGVGCQITLHINEKTDQIVRVTGVEGSPTNDGMLCVKGRYGYDFVNSEERLTAPLIRDKNGDLKEASWEEAITLVADTLGDIKEKYGPQSIAGLSSAKCTNEDNFAFQKFMRREVGTNNVDHCARL
jgi:predicted molibdopterin-dependent oxidoreductase YjgC